MPRFHKNPGYSDRIAVAPYNFVPLPERVLIADRTISHPNSHNVYEGYTGSFECVLETCSPMFIRGMITARELSEGKDGKDQPSFFSLDGGKTPIIPGSSLRGLLRSMVEIVSYSRLRWVMNHRLAYRAVDTTSLGVKYRSRIMAESDKNYMTPRVHGGYMRQHQGEWYIQPAQEIGGTTFSRISLNALERVENDLEKWPGSKNACAIYIQPGPFQFQEVRGGFVHVKYAKTLRASAQPGTGLSKAALVYSGKMLSKRSEAIIFGPDESKTGPENGWIAVNTKDAQGNVVDDREADYLNQISDEQKVLLGPQGALRNNQPVFYLMERGKLVLFGHTMMMRIPYRHSPLDMVPAELRQDDMLDLADAIFGYVRETKDETGRYPACAGRVFTSDARCLSAGPDIYERQMTPKVLATPKPTTFQHYVEQPLPDDSTQLRDYDQNETSVRGHKLYWHKGNCEAGRIEETDPQKLKHASQYTKVRPVRAGVQFKFTIRFENFSPVELGALGWVLRLAADAQHCLKLGMGKPLGMGAVRINSTLHLTDRPARYKTLFDANNDWATGAEASQSTSQALDEAIKAFEMWVLSEHSEINVGGAEDLSQLPRIREFLKLLEWPGPDPVFTRYMEIEHPDRNAPRGKRNEFRSRPVLPYPTAVGRTAQHGEHAPAPRREYQEEHVESNTREQPRRDVSPTSPPPPTTDPIPEVRDNVSTEATEIASQLSQENYASEGEVYEATVLRVTANDYECRLGQGIRTLGKLPCDEKKGLRAGDKVRVKVRRITQRGAAILTVRSLPKA